MSELADASARKPAAAKLYSPQLLSLATQLANFPLTADLPLQFEARSRTCGSVVAIGFALAKDDGIDRIGCKVTACAVGQAAAAIMAGDIRGQTFADIQRALTQIESWLKTGGNPPEWHGFDALLPVLPHAGRHGALLLPWQAALGALSMNDPAS